MKKIEWVNVLRGIAILLMIPANFAGLWVTPHPMWFRLMGSYAAPTFIMLSAGMVVLHAKNHHLNYYLQRGGIIFFIAALIDLVCWHQMPFLWIDVLYLIGLILPISYYASRLSVRSLILLALFFILLAPVMQMIFGYHELPLEVRLTKIYWPGSLRILMSWFIDGWFPFFPWLAYGFLGCALFKTLSINTDYQMPRRLLVFGCVTAVIGLIFLFIPTTLYSNLYNGGIYSDRFGVSDIFYPPTLAYILSSIGMVLILVRISQIIEWKAPSRLISVFGQHSMLAYVLHSFFIAFGYFAFRAFNKEPVIHNGWLFLLTVLTSIIIIYYISCFVQNNQRIKQHNFLFLQVLLGVGGRTR